MNTRTSCIVISVLCFLTACSSGQKKQSTTFVPKKFPTVDIPGVITDDSERTAYTALHFWDTFTDPSVKSRCDTSYVNGVSSKDLEQATGAYVSILNNIPLKDAKADISQCFDQIERCEKSDTSSNIFEVVGRQLRKYLYDPNSPLRNEDIYLPFVEKLSRSPYTSEETRMGSGFDARMCALNQVGTRAADFSFTDDKGRLRTLYGVKADYTLLFFGNPGCEACKMIVVTLRYDPNLKDMVSSGHLKVVSVYIDQETDKWKAAASEFPKDWINGYDQDYRIRTDVIYNVRAIPSIYLLDKDKNVLLKDATKENVLDYLVKIHDKL
jgi:hypothetical protein